MIWPNFRQLDRWACPIMYQVGALFFPNRLYSKFKHFVVKSNPISFKGAVFFSMCNLSVQFQQNSPARYAILCFQFSFFQFVVYGGPLILTRSFKMTNYSCFHDSTKKSGEATSGQRHSKNKTEIYSKFKITF